MPAESVPMEPSAEASAPAPPPPDEPGGTPEAAAAAPAAVGPLHLEADPPYWMVAFWSMRTDDDDGYAEAATAMVELAAHQPGFLGVESARDGAAPGRPGITVSYWRDEASIAAWRHHVEHAAIRREGVARWYEATTLTVGRVDRRHEWRR